MKKFIAFPKIGQFRNIIKQVETSAQFVGLDEDENPIYDKSVVLPTIKFTGTVKLHGTNAGVCFNYIEGLWAQSRKNIITVEKDNAGFAFFVESNREHLMWLIKDIAVAKEISLEEDTITLYGEWCGGNIQKGVAISGLDKMFVIFGIKVTPHDEDLSAYWWDLSVLDESTITDETPQSDKILRIDQFPTYDIDIDFNNPALSQNKLIDLTLAVEEQCPVGKHFGNEGIGEGIVFSANWRSNSYKFKSKGEKHSASKVKKLNEVDVEKIKNIEEFIEYAVTENRLNQGIEQVFTIESIEPDRKLTGAFVKWVSSDVIKEEIDTLVENGLEPRDVGGRISKFAARWFQDYLDKKVGL